MFTIRSRPHDGQKGICEAIVKVNIRPGKEKCWPLFKASNFIERKDGEEAEQEALAKEEEEEEEEKEEEAEAEAEAEAEEDNDNDDSDDDNY